MTPLLTALLILLGALTALGIYTYFRPIVTQPAMGTARNYLFHIVLPRSKQYRAAVFAQELYEMRRRLRLLLVFGFFWKREMQLFSHAIECAAVELVYNEDPVAYAYQEARRMLNYDELSGMDEAEIAAAMIERLPKARAWVEANRKLVERYR